MSLYDRKPEKKDFLGSFLLVVVCLLLFVIVAGTIWAFASGRAHPGTHDPSGVTPVSLFARGKHNPSPDSVVADDAKGKTAIFGEIGLLRAKTADREPVTVVVSPFMPYISDDIPFREELMQKTRLLRTSVLDWFAKHTLKQLNSLGESGVKKELIGTMNANLVLGQITVLYFEEYMVLR
jgi:flagellar basal body-associated protein FliL